MPVTSLVHSMVFCWHIERLDVYGDFSAAFAIWNARLERSSSMPALIHHAFANIIYSPSNRLNNHGAAEDRGFSRALLVVLNCAWCQYSIITFLCGGGNNAASYSPYVPRVLTYGCCEDSINAMPLSLETFTVLAFLAVLLKRV